MKTISSQILLLLALAFIPLTGNGQSYYSTYGLDDSTDYLYGDIIGYPGPGSCAGLSLWNSVNGNYVSGWAPIDLASGTYGVEGVTYDWEYGYTEEFEFVGSCITSSGRFSNPLSLHTTYFQGPSIVGINGLGGMTCTYGSLACTSGTPACDSRLYLGFNFSSNCPSIIKVGYLVYNNTTCVAGLAFDATGQTIRICT